jgi:peptidoglycan/LPS O-acetylase OafA/YrhL
MGCLRFLLATMVVFHHLMSFPFVGHHAVLFFFVISGYLMTLVMQTRYGYSVNGFQRFWYNRALRLYPAYFVVLLISVIVIFIVSNDVSAVFRAPLYMPDTAFAWAQNVSMIYVNVFPNEVLPRLSPATWALTVELFYYFLISVGLSASRVVTVIWFFVSLLYVALCLLTGQPSSYLYFSILAGSLPFATGAMIYHFRDRWSPVFAGREARALFLAAGLLVGILVVRMAVKIVTGHDGFESVALVLTTVSAALAMCSLLQRPWSPLSPKLDKLAGDLAYPLYISHWIIGLAVAAVLGISKPSLSLDGVILFGLALPLSLGVSYAIIMLLDVRVERLRSRIRAKAKSENS